MSAIRETTRREFLVQLGGLGVMLTRPPRLLGQEKLPARMIPGTNESLPIIGLGSSKPVLEIPTEGTPTWDIPTYKFTNVRTYCFCYAGAGFLAGGHAVVL